MLGKLLGAEAELQAMLASLRSAAADSNAATGCQAQLASVQSLRSTISTTRPADLAAFKPEVATTVAATRAAVQEARAASSDAQASQAVSLAAISATTRAEVQSLGADLFERHIFDKSLRFTSAEDETEYRRREAEARRYIEEQLAHHTDEGNLNAAGATAGQMLDAHAHGAGDSPEFLPRWNKLVETIHKQHEAMRAEGKSTEEFDRNVNAAVRRYLKAKGLTDAEIDARLAASPDPLEAVKPYIENERDARAMDMSIGAAARASNDRPTQAITTAVADTASTTPVQMAGLDDVMAKFQSNGVAASEQKPGDGFAHGLNAQDRPQTTRDRSSPAV